MNDPGFVPFVDWQYMVDVALRDFRLSYLACIAMVAARGWGTIRIRKHRPLPFLAQPVWSTAFYWPVYVWAFEAPWSVWYETFVGVTGKATSENMAYALVHGWKVIYAGVLPLLLIVHIGAATQAFVNRFRCPTIPWQVSIPISVVVAALGAFFVESALLLAFLTNAMQRGV